MEFLNREPGILSRLIIISSSCQNRSEQRANSNFSSSHPSPSSSLRCQTSKRNNLISIQIYSGECKIFNTFPIFRLSCLFLAIIINLRMMHIKMQMSYCKNYSCFMQIIFCQLWNKRLRVKRYGINFCLHYLYGK